MALDPQKHSAVCTGKKCWGRKHHFVIRPIVSQYLQKFHGNKTVFISLFEGNANADLGCPGYALFRDWRSLREPSRCKCGVTIEWGCLRLLYRLSVERWWRERAKSTDLGFRETTCDQSEQGPLP